MHQDGNGAIPDTVQVKPRSVVFEIPTYLAQQPEPDGNGAIPDTVQVKPQSTVLEIPASLAREFRGTKNDTQDSDGNGAIPDTVQTKPESIVLELPAQSVADGNGAIPDTVQTKLRSIVLEVPCHLAEDGNGAIPDTIQVKLQSIVLEVSAEAAQDGNGAIPDTVQVVPQSVVLEVPCHVACGEHLRSWNSKPKSSLGYLDEDQLDFWRDNGYLVIDNAIKVEKATKLVAKVEGTIQKLFESGNHEQVSHYMQAESANLRPNGRLIVTLANDSVDMTLDPIQRVRRIGTGVHRLVPEFRNITFNEANRQIALALGLRDPRVVQSQIITKAAKVGGEVIPHQDGCTTFTNPPSSITFWYALQPTTTENGCLKVVPGSHRTTPLRRRCRVDDKGYPQFVALDEPLYADVSGSNLSSEPSSITTQVEHEFRELQVGAGALILMHGNLLHASEANRSDRNRMAYNFGVVEGSLPWLPDSFLQPYDGEHEFERLELKL